MSTRLADLTQYRTFQQPMFEKVVDGYTVTLMDVADRLCKMKFRGWPMWEYTGISFVATSRVEGSYVGGSLTITLQDGCAAIGIEVPKRRMKVTYKRFGVSSREQIGLKPISSELLESVQVFNEPEITIGPIPHPDNDRCPDNCDSKLIHGLYRDDRDGGVYGEKYRKPPTATVPTDGVSTGWKTGTPIVDALLQECSNCHFNYPRLQDGLCEQCWLNLDFFKQGQSTEDKDVTYSRYCYVCHAVFDSPEAFDRVYCEDCNPSNCRDRLAQLLKAITINGKSPAWLVVPQVLYDEFAEMSCAMAGTKNEPHIQHRFQGVTVISIESVIEERNQRKAPSNDPVMYFLPDSFVGDRVPFPSICPICGKVALFDEHQGHQCDMTLERAVAVLNEHRHGDNDWEIVSGEVHSTFGGDALSEFEAIACAEKLEREK